MYILVSPLMLYALPILWLFVVRTQALQCVGTDGCGCTMEDGTVIDVSSIGNMNNTPMKPTLRGSGDNGFNFSCEAVDGSRTQLDPIFTTTLSIPAIRFSEGTCSAASVCQIDSTKTVFYQAGDSNTGTWSYDGLNAVVYYESKTEVFRQSFVTYICDRAATIPNFRAIGEQGLATYYFEVRTRCACPNGCISNKPHNEGGNKLSAGSILLIVFFVLLFVYLVVGMVFNQTQRQARGLDIIPNISFWRALPGLSKDGCLFVFGKLRGPGSKKGYENM